MSSILILYSTTDGHTRKICSEIEQIILHSGHQASVMSIREDKAVNLDNFDKIVIGASIRYGKHHEEVYEFIKQNLQMLEQKPAAFFSVNLVARKPGKNQPDSNPYMKKFLSQIPWSPEHLAVFAGRLNYRIYSFRDRWIIRLIMWITKGPTDLNANVEFTNWQQVKAFGQTICDM